jgi:hypothetical protein
MSFAFNYLMKRYSQISWFIRNKLHLKVGNKRNWLIPHPL